MKQTLEDAVGGKEGSFRRNPPRHSPRQLRYCDLVASGYSQAQAWKIAYKHPKASNEDASEHGWRVSQSPGIRERIEELRKQSGVKVLLTLNDRLAILAEIAQNKSSKPTDKARAIEVYSRISGDQAPDRHEHTGPNGQPIPVSATALVGPLSRREKLAMIRERRLAR